MKKNNKLILIFGGILLLAIFNFGFGNDYYWHVKAGEYIVSNLEIPYYDIFSWFGISNHLYWISHEWLSEVLIYLYNLVFKNFGALIFNITTYLILVIFLLKFNKEKMLKNPLFTLFWISLGFLTFSSVMLPRPHMISYVLLLFCFYLLYNNFYNENSNKIYFLPLISMLWVNFHGGSSNLPYILCILFLFVGLFEFKFGKLEAKKINKNQIKKYFICFVLCLLVLVINPHGIKMLTYPYVNMQDEVMISNISEWASPNLNKVSDLYAFILLGSITFILIATRKKIEFIDFVMLGVFLILGFKSLKFIPLLYIVSTFIVFKYIGNFKFEINKGLSLFIIILMIFSACLFTSKLIASYNKKLIPDKVINYIKKEKPKKLFNFYDYGGYLIYNDIKVFIDGRADMYSAYTLDDTFKLQDKGYQYILDKYNFDMFVIPNNISLNIYLSNNKDYILTKQVENVLIYEKKSH